MADRETQTPPLAVYRRLMRENERLTAENAALRAQILLMRPIVEAVANATHAGGNSTVAYISDLLIHQARAFLASQQAAESEGE